MQIKISFFLLILGSSWISCTNSEDQSDRHPAAPAAASAVADKLRDSINQFPGDPVYPYKLALALQDQQQYSEALRIIDSAFGLRSVQEDADAVNYYWSKKAELEELSGDTTAAINTYEQGLRPGELSEPALRLLHLYAETLSPKTLPLAAAMEKSDSAQLSPDINYLRGLYYFNGGEYPTAIREFDKAIRKEYQYIDAYLEKGIAYYEMKKYPEAMQTLDLALTISNSFPDGYYWKGKVEEAMGKKVEARENYLRAYGLDHSFREAKEAADRLSANQSK